MLNIKSSFYRLIFVVIFFISLGVGLCLQWPNIYSLLFNQLPFGFGLNTSLSFPILLMLSMGLLVIGFGLSYSKTMTIQSVPCHNSRAYFNELRIKLVFGACFGCLTGILCSLFYVLFEGSLPNSFLQYDVLFRHIEWGSVLLLGAFSTLVYLWGALQLSLFSLKRLLGIKQDDLSPVLALFIIFLSAVMASLLVVLIIITVAGDSPLSLILFSATVSFISFGSLGILYWLIGIEASMVANIVSWLLISYLAQIFL